MPLNWNIAGPDFCLIAFKKNTAAMKTTVLFLSLLLSFSAYSQFEIPNANFEEWDFNGWNFSPTGWQTNNTQLTQDVFQDSAAYEGELAMRVEATLVELGAYGEASIEIPTAAIPASLDFYAKWERTYTAAVGVEIIFYNQESVVIQSLWMPDSISSDWVPISMPLEQIEPIITHVEIKVYAAVGDFAPGEGWISIDAMSINGPNALDEFDSAAFSIYPVPAVGEISLDVDERFSPQRITIVDATGRTVMDVPYASRLSLSGFAAGQYVLLLSRNYGEESDLARTKTLFCS